MRSLALPPHQRPWTGRALAVGASGLLHLLALLWLQTGQNPPASTDQPPLRIKILPITLAAETPAAPTHARAAAARRAAPRIATPSHPRAGGQVSRPSRPGRREASAGSGEARVTIEGLRQQMRRLTPENPNAKPLPENPEKARLARGIERAERADCKHAYAGLGLLAAPMLLKDALDKDNGCKW
ncbi:hypothetical protein CXB49_18505 [Chromobacterium sp. ATCC 53434]|uniref:hypothetical protein n=1 Tax=Chromobacterium sp. (strain ATCC 53434 / SC 14030) TaxID=2059672 RepID=UPI000C78BBBA|nr:hypothetical protein [Chromobacterium sp. ATCC 53434]AUH52639.1 hypothetical protein CXB49_18505 [Chromobacterium sp. ATCC 53434]